MNYATKQKAIKSAVKKMVSYIRNWFTPRRRKALLYFAAVLIVRALLNETKPTDTMIGTALTLLPDFLLAIV